MIREAKVIKKMIGWNDPVDIISIKVFLHEDKHDGLHDAIVEEKKCRAICEEGAIKLRSKKTSRSNKEAYVGQKLELVSFFTDLEDISITKEWWEKDKVKEKNDVSKVKAKAIMVEVLDI